ncbi:MAG: SCO family protein [Caulobacteraceae bacterium]
MTARIARNGSLGEHSFAVGPRMGPSRRGFAIGALALALAGCGESGRGPAPSDIGGSFVLTDQSGARVDERILRGKWTAVFFGYTFCPDVCPTTLTTLAAAIDLLGPDARRFQVAFITIDPERDTPAQLKTYLSSPAFPKGTIGLTGTAAQIASVARAYHVYYKKAGEGANYSMDHTSIVYLMDLKGRFSRPIAFGAAPPDIAKQIKDAMHGA